MIKKKATTMFTWVSLTIYSNKLFNQSQRRIIKKIFLSLLSLSMENYLVNQTEGVAS